MNNSFMIYDQNFKIILIFFLQKYIKKDFLHIKPQLFWKLDDKICNIVFSIQKWELVWFKIIFGCKLVLPISQMMFF